MYVEVKEYTEGFLIHNELSLKTFLKSEQGWFLTLANAVLEQEYKLSNVNALAHSKYGFEF